MLKLGADILVELGDGRTVSELWEAIRKRRRDRSLPPIHFDWFVLVLSFLFSVKAVDHHDGVIWKANQP